MLDILVMAATMTATGDPTPGDPGVVSTGGFGITAPSPHVAVGAEYGWSAWERLVDAGVEGQAFWFPMSESAVGIGLGTYLRVAPIPGEWGRRFYLHGKINRTVATGTPTFNAFGLGGGLGYRQPLEATPFGVPGYWYVETGLQRAFLFKYGEALYFIEALETGFTW